MCAVGRLRLERAIVILRFQKGFGVYLPKWRPFIYFFRDVVLSNNEKNLHNENHYPNIKEAAWLWRLRCSLNKDGQCQQSTQWPVVTSTLDESVFPDCGQDKQQ